MKIIKNILAIVGLVCISGLFIFAVQKAPSDNTLESNPKLINDYNVYAISVPEHLDFAGEKVPLKDPDVYERMDRELLVNTFWLV